MTEDERAALELAKLAYRNVLAAANDGATVEEVAGICEHNIAVLERELAKGVLQ